ncbi:hypothetical protein JW998_07905 [candidate division KSB1 bacterium]|nr:hypothetical protein [candidate division KSB1 bacterium]
MAPDFPAEINEADTKALLCVMGFGLISAKKTISRRRIHQRCCEDKHKIDVILQRAHYSPAVNGKSHAGIRCGHRS